MKTHCPFPTHFTARLFSEFNIVFRSFRAALYALKLLLLGSQIIGDKTQLFINAPEITALTRTILP